jgi:hypothetical protein
MLDQPVVEEWGQLDLLQTLDSATRHMQPEGRKGMAQSVSFDLVQFSPDFVTYIVLLS